MPNTHLISSIWPKCTEDGRPSANQKKDDATDYEQISGGGAGFTPRQGDSKSTVDENKFQHNLSNARMVACIYPRDLCVGDV